MPSSAALERAKAAICASDLHCRYCPNYGPDAHPAMKCKHDIEDAYEAIAEAIDIAVQEAKEEWHAVGLENGAGLERGLVLEWAREHHIEGGLVAWLEARDGD